MTSDRSPFSLRENAWLAGAVQFVVIVTAVLSALQIHSWQETRDERRRAAELTGDLINDMIVEGRLMRNTIEYFAVVIDYAREADRVYGLEAPVDDEAFLIALYNASQVVTPQRIGAEYQTLVARGEGHLIDADLTRLMVRHYSSKNLPLISRHVYDSVYRDLLRTAMPSDVQQIIREQCGDIRGEEGYVDALSQDCDVDFGDIDTRTIATQLHADGEMREALAHMLGNLEASIIDNRADLRYLESELAEFQP